MSESVLLRSALDATFGVAFIGVVCLQLAAGQDVTLTTSCGSAVELPCEPAGSVTACTDQDTAWLFQSRSGADVILPASSAWSRVDASTCSLHLGSVVSAEEGVYLCCVSGFMTAANQCGFPLYTVQLNLNSTASCTSRLTTQPAPATPAATLRRVPTFAPLTTQSVEPTETPRSLLTTTQLILVLAGAGIILIIILVVICVCYQRYALGKLRTNRSQHLSLTSTTPRNEGYQRKMRTELSATSIMPELLSVPAANKENKRTRKLGHSYSEPRIQMRPQSRQGGGWMGAGMMGFDGAEDAPSAYSIQTKAFSGFHNNFYQSLVDTSDGLGDIDNLVNMVDSHGCSDERRHSQTLPKRKAETFAEERDAADDDETDGGDRVAVLNTPTTFKSHMVRHYSWHSPGGGFTATMKSGSEVSSPFAHFVTTRMAVHRSSSTQSPTTPLSNGPLTEEELEEMLVSDPEMSAVDYDTGTDDVDGQSDS